MVIQTERLLELLFPGNTITNALLATSYISIIPNALLYFVPKEIQPATISLLFNFAGGSLLGDLFLHLLPHVFGAQKEDIASDIDYKNILIGTCVFLGVFMFYAIDKCMRSCFEELSYDHIQSKKISQETNISVEGPKKRYNLRPRKVDNNNKKEENKIVTKEIKSTVRVDQIRPSTYLNLMADFIHNLTDGMALAASFYISPTVGATTTMAVFFHEIPHEISDFIMLLKTGSTRASALRAQFTTTVGAYIGALIGIALLEVGKYLENSRRAISDSFGLFGTTVGWNDAILAVIAGGFLYVATAGIIPKMLSTKSKDRIQPIKELLSMMSGLVVMEYISWNEQRQKYE